MMVRSSGNNPSWKWTLMHFCRSTISQHQYPADIDSFKVNNGNTGTIREIYLKWTLEKPWGRSGAFLLTLITIIAVISNWMLPDGAKLAFSCKYRLSIITKSVNYQSRIYSLTLEYQIQNGSLKGAHDERPKQRLRRKCVHQSK